MGEETDVLTKQSPEAEPFSWGALGRRLIGPAIGAGAASLGSIPQMIEARRLKKERERLLQQGAPGLTPIEQQQMAEARARAASALAPGYAQEMEGIAQQQADVLAAGKRGSQTGSNLLNLLSRMNAQGQAARRNLAMRGAQAQRQAQGELTSLSMNADARREQRQQLFERQLAAMDAARRQYNASAGMAPVQGAVAFMPTEGFKFGAAKPKTDVTAGTKRPDGNNGSLGLIPGVNPSNRMYGRNKNVSYEQSLMFPDLALPQYPIEMLGEMPSVENPFYRGPRVKK
jgi:hypothetical protein